MGSVKCKGWKIKKVVGLINLLPSVRGAIKKLPPPPLPSGPITGAKRRAAASTYGATFATDCIIIISEIMGMVLIYMEIRLIRLVAYHSGFYDVSLYCIKSYIRKNVIFGTRCILNFYCTSVDALKPLYTFLNKKVEIQVVANFRVF